MNRNKEGLLECERWLEISHAAYAASENSDLEPLAKLIEAGNPDILKDEYLREILLKRVRGVPWCGSGKRKVQKEENRKRDNWIMAHLYLLKGNGWPIWAEEGNYLTTACYQVSEALPMAGCTNISPASVHKIWQRDKKKAGSIYAKSQYDIGLALKQDGFKLTISKTGIKVTGVDKK